MLNLTFLRTTFSNLLSALQRFPLTCLGITVLYAMSLIGLERNLIATHVSLFMTILASISFVASLHYETTEKPRLKEWLVTVGSTALIYAYYSFSGTKHLTDFIALFFALSLLTFVAPFFRQRDNEKLSYFWQQIIFAMIWASLNFVILCGGGSLVIACINVLFDNVLPTILYDKLWNFGLLFFLPISFLAMLPGPKKLASVTHCNTPRALKVTISWLLAPLALLFLAVLHAYFLKILMVDVFPKNSLVSIIIAIAIYSVFVYLMTYPMISGGNTQARFIQKYMFLLLAIPGAVLAWRFGVRIWYHGMTEQRFYVVLIVLWLAFNIIYHLRHRRIEHDLRVPVLSAALLLLVTALSPVSPTYFSPSQYQSRQMSQLLIDGHYLFMPNYRNPQPEEISVYLNFNGTTSYSKMFIPVRGYDAMITENFAAKRVEAKEHTLDKDIVVKFYLEDQQCKILFLRTNKPEQVLALPCKEKAMELMEKKKLFSAGQKGIYRNWDTPVTMDITEGKMKLRLYLTNISAAYLKSDPRNTLKIRSLSGTILIGGILPPEKR